MKSQILALAVSAIACGCAKADNPNPDNAVVYNVEDNAKLVGTWLLPENSAPKAVMVLATGSGQQDRDETLMNHRPFRAIAERLAKEGYGVLRLDDRGIGGSTGAVETATTANFTGDIRCALQWLDSVSPGIPKGVLGHSEGGLMAVSLAQDPLCDFIVTLGGPAMPGDSITLTQGRAMAVAMTGRYDAEPLQKELLAAAKSELPDEEAKKTIMDKLMTSLGAQAYVPGVKRQLEQQVDVLLSPWYREFLRNDPTDKIKSVEKPWLALNGDKDTQVLPVNLEIIGQLNPNATCVLLPDHNHLFLECVTGLPTEYESLSGDISEMTLSTIVEWLDRQFK